MLSYISTKRLLHILPVFINSVSFKSTLPKSSLITCKRTLSATHKIKMDDNQYEQFGMDNDPKSFPEWCHPYFKHHSYTEVRLLPMQVYTDTKYGHLINDTLMGKNGFRIRCFVNNISKPNNLTNNNNGINITDTLPPEGVNQYRGLFELRTVATQLIFLVDVGTHCCGHTGIWHGGVTSAILDNTFGFLGSIYFPLAATKSLNIRFLRPIHAGTPVLISTEFNPDSSFETEKPDLITAESYVYLPTGKLAATGKCEIVDVSNKWNKN